MKIQSIQYVHKQMMLIRSGRIYTNNIKKYICINNEIEI